MLDLTNDTTHRRGFLGRLAAGAAAFGLGGLAVPSAAVATPRSATSGAAGNPEFEAWLNKITGKHKMIYDVPEPNDGFAFWWARVFLNTTNETYGTTDADNTVVIVRSEEHTSELQSQSNLVCRLLLEKKNRKYRSRNHV